MDSREGQARERASLLQLGRYAFRKTLDVDEDPYITLICQVKQHDQSLTQSKELLTLSQNLEGISLAMLHQY